MLWANIRCSGCSPLGDGSNLTHTYIHTYIHIYIYYITLNYITLHYILSTHKPTELSRIKLKFWTQQPVPMMSENSAHLTSLPIGFRTWFWWYTYLLLILMLRHRQEIFESKGNKLSSSAECSIRIWEVWDTNTPAEWIPNHMPACIHTYINMHVPTHTCINTYMHTCIVTTLFSKIKPLTT